MQRPRGENEEGARRKRLTGEAQSSKKWQDMRLERNGQSKRIFGQMLGNLGFIMR